MFYRKPGKIAATTLDVWEGIVERRGSKDAAAEVATMVADGRLVVAPED